MEKYSALLALCAEKSQGPLTRSIDVFCAWTNGWVYNRDSSALRCHHAHYEVTVMGKSISKCHHNCGNFFLDLSALVVCQFLRNPPWKLVYLREHVQPTTEPLWCWDISNITVLHVSTNTTLTHLNGLGCMKSRFGDIIYHGNIRHTTRLWYKGVYRWGTVYSNRTPVILWCSTACYYINQDDGNGRVCSSG